MIPHDHVRHAQGGKLLGACEGLAERTGANPNVLRAAAIVLLIVWFKLTILLYCATAVALRVTQR